MHEDSKHRVRISCIGLKQLPCISRAQGTALQDVTAPWRRCNSCGPLQCVGTMMSGWSLPALVTTANKVEHLACHQ